MAQKVSVRGCVIALQDHTGSVYAGVLAAEDVIYVKVVKSDLIAILKGLPEYPDGRSPFRLEVTEGELYVHINH